MAFASLLADLNGRLAEFQALRRDIHRYPELAYEEHRTAAVVAEVLERYGLDVVTGIACTGVVGILKSGTSSRAIGLRADMDALELQETNDLPYRSEHSGKMHGCGHDGHTSTLLAAAAYLSESRAFDGTVYFIFQPAEEGRAGAQRMIDEGLFERFPMEAVFGLHNLPGLPVGSFAVRSGPQMAGADRFDIVVEGVGGHGAFPHLASDPVVASAAIIQATQSIVARNKDPMSAAVLSITQIQGGTAFNVIPDRVELSGTVRYLEKETQALIEERMKAIVAHVAEGHGCRATLNYTHLFPATVNWADETAVSLRVLQNLFGEDKVETDRAPLLASEDFAFMLAAKPGCYILAGNGDNADVGNIHSPTYDFNDELIVYGAAYWVRLVEAALATN